MFDHFTGPDAWDDDQGRGCGEVECRICGADELHWEQDETTGRWQLIEEDQTVHRCPETAGEFVFDPVHGLRKVTP